MGPLDRLTRPEVPLASLACLPEAHPFVNRGCTHFNLAFSPDGWDAELSSLILPTFTQHFQFIGYSTPCAVGLEG